MTQTTPPSWWYRLGHLALAGGLFLLSYRLLNEITAQRTDVGEYFFAWEPQIPFLAWSIIPYWLIDGFYILAFMLCDHRQELRVLCQRLILANLLAIIGFGLWPLQFSWPKPTTEGLSGWLFTQLASFDLPYNQAPSLHIILLVVLWRHYHQHLHNGLARITLHLMAMTIAISVLTTYQHHCIDLITGLIAGLTVLYLIPEQPWHTYGTYAAPGRWALAALYGCATLLLTILTWVSSAWARWLWLWPACNLLLVAVAYAGIGARVFQKHAGRYSLAAAILLWPYRCGAWIAMRLQTSRLEPTCEIEPGLLLGHWPWRIQALPANICIIDLCAELSTPRHWNIAASVPMLDLTLPDPDTLKQAAQAIIQARQAGHPVLTHCALGLSRSAAVMATTLLLLHPDMSVEEALAHIRSKRPIVVSAALQNRLAQLIQQHRQTLCHNPTPNKA